MASDLLALAASAPGLMIMAFIASLIQRIAGLGFGIAMASFALATWDPFNAVFVTSIIGIGVTTITMAQLWRHIVWPVVWPLIPPVTGFMCLGLIFTWAFGKNAYVWMTIQGGGLIVLALTIRPILARVQTTTAPWIARAWVGGPLTGFLSSTIGIPGPTAAPYFFTRGVVGTAFVASICPMFFITAIVRIAIGRSSPDGESLAALAILGAFFAVLGVLAGSLIAPRVPLRQQRLLIVGLILLSAGHLAWAFGESFYDVFLNASIS